LPEPSAAWRARAAFVALVLWAAAMLYLVVTSANPPIVSRPQVLSADALVEGTLDVGAQIRLKPDVIVWSRRPLQLSDLPADGILIADQSAAWMRTGVRAYAPLREIEPGRFTVQPIPFEVERPQIQPDVGPAPIYPATNVVRRQLTPLAPKKAVP